MKLTYWIHDVCAKPFDLLENYELEDGATVEIEKTLGCMEDGNVSIVHTEQFKWNTVTGADVLIRINPNDYLKFKDELDEKFGKDCPSFNDHEVYAKTRKRSYKPRYIKEEK